MEGKVSPPKARLSNIPKAKEEAKCHPNLKATLRKHEVREPRKAKVKEVIRLEVKEIRELRSVRRILIAKRKRTTNTMIGKKRGRITKTIKLGVRKLQDIRTRKQNFGGMRMSNQKSQNLLKDQMILNFEKPSGVRCNSWQTK